MQLLSIAHNPESIVLREGSLQFVQVTDNLSTRVSIDELAPFAKSKIVQDRNGKIIIGLASFKEGRIGVWFHGHYLIPWPEIFCHESQCLRGIGLEADIMRTKDSPRCPRADGERKKSK